MFVAFHLSPSYLPILILLWYLSCCVTYFPLMCFDTILCFPESIRCFPWFPIIIVWKLSLWHDAAVVTMLSSQRAGEWRWLQLNKHPQLPLSPSENQSLLNMYHRHQIFLVICCRNEHHFVITNSRIQYFQAWVSCNRVAFLNGILPFSQISWNQLGVIYRNHKCFQTCLEGILPQCSY